AQWVLHDDDKQDAYHHQKQIDQIDHRKQRIISVVMVEKAHQRSSSARSIARSSCNSQRRRTVRMKKVMLAATSARITEENATTRFWPMPCASFSVSASSAGPMG